MYRIELFRLLLVLITAVLSLTSAWAQKPSWKHIEPDRLQSMLEQNEPFMLINTMSDIECRDHAIPKSICIPCETFDARIGKLPRDRQFKLVYYCESDRCLRSYKSADKAIKQGYTNVYVLKGGLPGWKLAGYGVVSQERIPRSFVSSVKPSLLKRWLGEGRPVSLVDIRSEEVFGQGHIEGAVNIPFYRLDQQYHELPLNRQIVLVDEMGFRSFLAACYLTRKGLDVTRLFGGMERWQLMTAAAKRSPAGKQR